jgi:Acetyltransferase (GNAT) domain
MAERRIELFHSSKQKLWNHFVAESANGTFLLDRRFMEYHSDRFEDTSIIVYDGTEIVGLLPASKHNTVAMSHGGLTYGGLIIGKSRSSAQGVYTTLSEVCEHLCAGGFKSLIYKPLPHMYHKVPSEADLYALFRLGGKLVKRDISSALAPFSHLEMRKGRKALVKRAKQTTGLEISTNDDWASFHALLQNRLETKYGTAPVHSANELKLLQSRFPDNIALTVAILNGVMIAGCVTFESDRVVHAQYLATNEIARENGAMDLLISDVIQQTLAKHKWFDFGISTTNNGLDLNVDLARYKEGFGAKSVVYDCYQLEF